MVLNGWAANSRSIKPESVKTEEAKEEEAIVSKP
jgi:hypothetical protein